jgi:hypothetical protein
MLTVLLVGERGFKKPNIIDQIVTIYVTVSICAILCVLVRILFANRV